jgi:hypothetical protein
MLNAIIPAADYLNICRFSSNEETRYYLNGVFVHRVDGGLPRLVATDGHRLGLLAFEDEQAVLSNDAASFTISNSKELQRACKASRNETVWLRCFSDRLEVIKVRAEVKAADLAEYTGEIDCTFPSSRVYVDGTFPDYTRVVPNPWEMSGAPAQGFNTTYLASFAFGRGHKVEPSISLLGDGPGSPALVFNGDARFVGVVMPLRAPSPPDLIERAAAILGHKKPSPKKTKTEQPADSIAA